MAKITLARTFAPASILAKRLAYRARRFVETGHWKHPRRAWRLWRAERIPREVGYERIWDYIGEDADATYRMMDGSDNEGELREKGKKASINIKDILLITKNDKVLEIGCGVARIGRELAPFCAQWYGVDIASNIIDIAKQRTQHLTNVHFEVLSRPSLNCFPDNYFDKVYSHIVFLHLDKEDMFLYIREIRRVLKPGGIAYYDAWNLLNDLGWQRWLQTVEEYRQTLVKTAHRNQWSTPEEMRLYTEKAGLRLVCCVESALIRIVSTKLLAEMPEDEASRQVAELRQRIQDAAEWVFY